MRILMISDVYFPRINGVSTSIQTFKQELEQFGHEVFLVVPSYSDADTPDPTITRISSRRVPLDPEDRMMRYAEVTAHLEQFRQLRPDIVHIQTPFVAHYAGLRIARALSIPCVCTYHTLFEEYLFHYIPWLPKQFLRFCARKFSVSQCNQVDGVITPSSVIRNLLVSYGVKHHMDVVPTGIHAAHFAHGNGAVFRRQLGIAADCKVLLNVSRVAFEKNIGLLLDVFAHLHRQLPNTHLVIAGEGPARQNLIERAHALQLENHISFVGYLDRKNELVHCYHAADVFVFASRTETQGLVLLEAMAAGLPVVAIADMGTRDVLVEGQGASITDGSVADFSARIEAVLTNQQQYEALCLSAVDYARSWDAASCAHAAVAVYQGIASKNLAQSESLAG